jgi:hypothetical protein
MRTDNAKISKWMGYYTSYSVNDLAKNFNDYLPDYRNSLLACEKIFDFLAQNRILHRIHFHPDVQRYFVQIYTRKDPKCSFIVYHGTGDTISEATYRAVLDLIEDIKCEQ